MADSHQRQETFGGYGPQTEQRFADRIRLPLSFDPARLQDDLARLEAEEWIGHFVKQNYDGEWSVLPLRAPVGAHHPIMQIVAHPFEENWRETKLLQRCPYFQEVLSAFRCPLQGARLMKLTPGSVIKEHSDPGLDAESGSARIHVPITTSGDVDFRVRGARAEMAAGEAWYLRLSEPHSVVNSGATARVHLVIDALVDPWMEAMLSGSGTVSADTPAAAGK